MKTKNIIIIGVIAAAAIAGYMYWRKNRSTAKPAIGSGDAGADLSGADLSMTDAILRREALKQKRPVRAEAGSVTLPQG